MPSVDVASNVVWVYISPGLSAETSTEGDPGRLPPTIARRRSKREPGAT